MPPVSVKEVVFDSAVSDIQVRQGPGWWFLWGWWHMSFESGSSHWEPAVFFFWFRDFFNPHFFSVCVGLKLLIGSQGRVSQVPGTILWQLQSRHCSASRIPLKIRFPVAGRRSKDGHHPDHQGVRILADVICFSWWNANRPWSAVVVKTALPKILKDLRSWHWNM